MKKVILFSLVLIAISLSSLQAQYNTSLPLVDTITNQDTSILVLPTADGYYRTFTFQLDAVKVSGTVSANVILQGSVKGGTQLNSWFNLDTLAMADVTGTQTRYYLEGPAKYLFYRYMVITPSGTQKFYIKGYLWRKE